MQSSGFSGRRRSLIVLVCFAAIVYDGYDLIVYGATIPDLLAYEPWSVSASTAGAIGSYTLLGMFFGAIAAGPLTERYGRRKLFISSLVWYSVAMLAVAAAPTPEMLGLFRFLAGTGFGAIAPVAISIVVEVARVGERNRLNALMLSGLPVGGVLAALAALVLRDALGFRGLWALGATALVVVVPAALRYIPETGLPVAAAAANGDADERMALRRLVVGRAWVVLVLFAVANFVGFLLVFGLNTWLPQLMKEAGYSLGSALMFQLLLNLGAVVGGVGGAMLADRFGARPIAIGAFLIAVVAIGAMAAAPPYWAALPVIVLAGAGSIGTQIVVFGFVATYYPVHVRATALGVTTGIGRLGAVSGPLLGGLLLSVGAGQAAIFAVFAGLGLVGVLACRAIPADSQYENATDRCGGATPASRNPVSD